MHLISPSIILLNTVCSSSFHCDLQQSRVLAGFQRGLLVLVRPSLLPGQARGPLGDLLRDKRRLLIMVFSNLEKQRASKREKGWRYQVSVESRRNERIFSWGCMVAGETQTRTTTTKTTLQVPFKASSLISERMNGKWQNRFFVFVVDKVVRHHYGSHSEEADKVKTGAFLSGTAGTYL